MKTIREYQTWPHWKSADYPMDHLPNVVSGSERNRDPWKLNPDYQRAACWADDQASRFVGHLISDGPVPPIFLQRYDSTANVPSGKRCVEMPIEVIDGQQRIRAMLRWMADEIPASMDDGAALWFRDLTEDEVRGLPFINVRFVDLSREERLRFYLRLNRGGTVHTDEEIQRVQTMLATEIEATP